MIQRRYLVIFVVLCIFAGIPVVHGTTITVGPKVSDHYQTIQAAIDNADNGDTITVAPGLYDERIIIKKPITLRGATAGISKKGYNVPAASANYVYNYETESVISPQDMSSTHIVVIQSNNVTLDGFVVSSTTAGSFTPYAPTDLIRMDTSPLNNVTIQNNVLGPNTNLTIQNGSAGRMGITIAKWSGAIETDTVYNLQIRNNKIFDAKGDGCGILMIGPKNETSRSPRYQFKGAVIDNNEITGNHRSGIDFSAGVQGGPDPADHIKITNNLITNNGWNDTVDKDNIKWGNGIVLLRMTDQKEEVPWASRYIDIEENEFSGNEKNAIYIGPVTRDVTIRNNIIRDNGRGTGDYSIWDGIRIDLDEDYQIRERARVGLPPLNVHIYDYLTNIVIDENQISGNGGFGLNVIRTPQKGPVEARNNWWGAESGPQNPVSNPAGTGDAVSINARYVPWYGDEPMTTPVVTAGGSGPILFVGEGNFTTIQDAINVALDGDAIKVSPGLYDERIVINRSVTLLGASSGISKKDYTVPGDYQYDTSAESIIQPSGVENDEVVEITAGNVFFDGFVVAHRDQESYPLFPVTHLIGLSSGSCDYDNVRIENNVIGPNTDLHHQDGMEGRSGIAVYGPNSRTMYNLTIVNNRIFDAKGDGCGILLLGSVTSPSVPGLAEKYRGSVIDNNTITGNHRSGIEFSGGVQGGMEPAGHFSITHNTISNNGWRNPSEKDNQKYGNGIVLIHVGSDKENPDAWGSEFLDIADNLITGNEKNGIYIGPVNRNISITNNTVRENGAGTGGYIPWDGIQVDLEESYHNPVYKNYGFLAGITVNDNEINANGNYGARVIGTPANGPIDARLNYWGDAGGPGGTANPGSPANPVSDYIDFDPWYRDAARTVPSDMPSPVAAFFATPLSGNAPLVVTFTDTSAGSPDTWDWDFGDNDATNATVQNPVHRYSSAGRYTVRLTVTNTTTGENTTVKSDYITVILPVEPPVADFTGSPLSGTAPLNVLFTDTSTGLPAGWLWDFGDGNSTNATRQNPVHRYGAAGLYTVRLTVTNTTTGTNTTVKSDYITVTRPVEPPVADFTGTPTNGTAPLVVTFTDTSTGFPTSWSWNFGDNDATNATRQNPVHRYNSSGVYTVQLTVLNTTTGANTTIKSAFINVTPAIAAPVANFTAIPTTGTIPLNVTFTDLSTGLITSWLWDVDQNNDRMECIGQLCNHTYEKPGIYTVTLIVSGDGGFDTMTKYGYINVTAGPPVANFSASPLNGTAPLAVQFTDTSEGLPDTWKWDFGDSSTTNATMQHPVHRYSAAGWYTVRLMVTNSSTGSDTTVKRNYIAVASPGVFPVASFSWSPFDGMIGETFSFDASATAALSKTGIRSYQWDFGDGNGTAPAADPAASHAFPSSRVYTVTLHVTDLKGMTNRTGRQVSIIAMKEPIPISFNGTDVSGEPGSQVITINTTATTGNVTNTTTGVTIENPGSGWANMEVKGNTSIDENGKLVISNISEVVLKAAPSVTEIGSGAGSPGNVTTSIDLALRQFVEAPLEVEVSEGANSTISGGFQMAAGFGNVVDAIAYTMTIKGSSLVNSNLSGSDEPVRLNMSVSQDWVDSHGGIEAIKVLRYSDDGVTKETLETRYLFTAGTPPMCYFEIISPHGLSIFGVASVVPAPPSPAPVPGAGYTAFVEGGSDDSGARSEIPATVITTVPTTVPVTPPSGGTPQAVSVPSLTVPAPGAGAIDIVRPVFRLPDTAADLLSFMEENLLKMTMLAGAACIGTALMIWYRSGMVWK